MKKLFVILTTGLVLVVGASACGAAMSASSDVASKDNVAQKHVVKHAKKHKVGLTPDDVVYLIASEDPGYVKSFCTNYDALNDTAATRRAAFKVWTRGFAKGAGPKVMRVAPPVEDIFQAFVDRCDHLS